MTMPGSCSSGLRSRPSAAAGSNRSKGFDVKSRNARKPVLIKPITPSTRARNGVGRLRLNTETAIVHRPSTKTHISIEPSCPPHTAAMR